MRHSLQGAVQRAPFFLAASLLVSTSFIPANAVSTPNDSASYAHTVSERSDDSASAVAPLSDDVLNADPQASVVAGQEGGESGAIPEETRESLPIGRPSVWKTLFLQIT